MKRTILLFLIMLISNCNEINWLVEIQSNTSWESFSRKGKISGEGNKTIDFAHYKSIICMTVRKKTAHGFVSVRMVDQSTGIFNPGNETDWVSTTEEYGEVSICRGN